MEWIILPLLFLCAIRELSRPPGNAVRLQDPVDGQSLLLALSNQQCRAFLPLVFGECRAWGLLAKSLPCFFEPEKEVRPESLSMHITALSSL